MDTYSGVAAGVVMGISIGVCLGWFTKDKTWGKGTESGDSKRSKSDDKPLVFSDWGEYKMVIVARQDLGMGKGKVAAQCCHAAVDLYKKARKYHQEWLNEWETSGCAKVVLKAPDEDTLVMLYAKAMSLGLPSTVISDAGRTQIAPGSRTVLGIGPAPKELIDEVTGDLKLY